MGKFTLRKGNSNRNRIISKVKAKYWRTTHKYGIRLPKNMEDALAIDKANGNDYWEQAVQKEMGKVKVACKPNEERTPSDVESGLAPELAQYQRITCHLIIDVKMDFTRKARFIANGSRTETPNSLTYSSIVSRESIKLAFLIAALNNLDVMSCDIGNAYLNSPCLEKVWFKAGKECGIDEGKVCIVVQALYGLKSSGASWAATFSDFIEKQLGFTSTRVDADVYRRVNTRTSGTRYELLLVYVDDFLVISHLPEDVMKKIGEEFNLKDGYAALTQYLGAGIERFQMKDGLQPCSLKATNM